MSDNNRDTWIFGYGSLIWHAGFAYINKRPACIEGWSRRFWQGSTDHRGIPGSPGRVVTLIPQTNQRCWGMAYQLDGDKAAEIMSGLDYREKGGYERLEVSLHFKDGDLVNGITYHATPANPNYLGEASVENIAIQILNSSGPSGSNIDYVLSLAASLDDIDAVDPHITRIATRVRKLMSG